MKKFGKRGLPPAILIEIAETLVDFLPEKQMFDSEESIKKWIKERELKNYDDYVVSDVAATIHSWNEGRKRK